MKFEKKTFQINVELNTYATKLRKNFVKTVTLHLYIIGHKPTQILSRLLHRQSIQASNHATKVFFSRFPMYNTWLTVIDVSFTATSIPRNRLNSHYSLALNFIFPSSLSLSHSQIWYHQPRHTQQLSHNYSCA